MKCLALSLVLVTGLGCLATNMAEAGDTGETTVVDGFGDYVKIPNSPAATRDLLFDAKAAAHEAAWLMFQAGGNMQPRTADDYRLIRQAAPKVRANIRAAIEKLRAAEVSLSRDLAKEPAR